MTSSMPELDKQLDQALADGKITLEDADAVRDFADFLSAAGPPPGSPGHDPHRLTEAITEHHEMLFGGPPPHPDGCPGCATGGPS